MYQQVTLATLQSQLAARYDALPYWSADEARRALNEGLRIYSAATGFWRTVLPLSTIPNDPYVALPGSLVQGSRVTWNGLPLEPASLFDFDYCFPNWRATTTASPGAPSRPLYWARISLTLLVIYPADATITNLNTDCLTVNGIRNTPILVNPLDWVDLGQEQFDVLLGYAAHVLAFKLGGQALVDTYPNWIDFLQSAARENRQFAASSFYRQLLGLDQQRRMVPLEAQVQSAADAAAQGGVDLLYPAQRIRQ